MMQFLIYDLKVAILIAVFYMFYRLLLSHETFHRVNRMVLLFTSLASFVLPLCIITMHRTVVLETVTEPTIDFATMAVENAEPQAPIWQSIVIALFFAGMIITLGKTLFSIISVWKLILRSERHVQPDGTTICIVGGNVSPFSWMKYIVISRKDHSPHLEDNGETFILAHERGHIRQHHSLDLLLVDTLTALQWFNPAMWMLRQDLRAIHEYEADAAVLSQGINMRQYQYLLIQKAVSRCGYSVANGISHSTLKNRIDMMLHKNSSRNSLLKLLALLPIVGATLALQAETVNDYVYTEKAQTPPQKVVKKGKTNTQVKGEKTPNGVVSVDVPEPDKAFDVVEQMPEYPGGTGELMKYLSTNVRYPAEAAKNGIQGRVLVQFVVEKDGSISEARVANKTDERLHAEAIRVVKAMSKWNPGKQNGKAVRVNYTLPITFRLQ